MLGVAPARSRAGVSREDLGRSGGTPRGNRTAPGSRLSDDAPRALAALYDVLLPSRPRHDRDQVGRGLYRHPRFSPLARLSFEALVVKSEPDGAPRYWLDEDAPIRYAVSSTLLTTLSARPLTASNGLLSVADPTYKSSAMAAPSRHGERELRQSSPPSAEAVTRCR